jgi:imidazolonepropionase-like amidohydrolase
VRGFSFPCTPTRVAKETSEFLHLDNLRANLSELVIGRRRAVRSAPMRTVAFARHVQNATLLTLTVIFPALLAAPHAVAQQAPVNGMRPSNPGRFALVGGKVIVAPGTMHERATVLVRDSVIEAVIPEDAQPAEMGTAEKKSTARVPDGYRVIDCTGKTLVSAFIEPALAVDSAALASAASAVSGAHWNSYVTPEVAGGDLALPDATLDALRAQGFAVARLLPKDGIFRGSSETRLLARASERVLPRDLGGTTVQVVGPRTIDWSAMFGQPAPAMPNVAAPTPTPRGERNSSYPSSLMGSYALLRQTFLDATWRRAALAVRPAQPLDSMNALDALQPLFLAENDPHAQSLLLDASDELDFTRMLRLVRQEMPTTAVAIIASGNEFRAEDDIASLVGTSATPIIVPVEFPQAPDLVSPVAAETISLRDLMTWRYAPTNPKRLLARGATIALTTHRLQDKGAFRKRVSEAMLYGLSSDEALAALTTSPARMLGLADRLGTLEAGKLANVIIANGDPLVAETKFEGVFVAGVPVVALPDAPVLAAGSFAVTAQSVTPKPVATDLRIALDPKDGSIKASWLAPVDVDAKDATQDGAQDGALDGATAPATPADPAGDPSAEKSAEKSAEEQKARDGRTTIAARRTSATDGRFAGLLDGTPFGLDGELRLSIAGAGDAATLTAERADGVRFVFTLTRRAEESAKADATEAPQDTKIEKKSDTKDDAKQDPKRDDTSTLWKDPLPFPLGEYGVAEKPFGGTVLFRNATIWTQGAQGILAKGDLLLRDGKIAAVAEHIDAPDVSAVFDMTGHHITPGLIDCHSHTGISGGVNEGTQSNTAEVWIGDVIDPTDIEWYRQLAGGLTAVNQLHGSANPIGGRNSVVKIRWGENAERFRFEGAPSGIKFALGENVTRSKSRYPSSRMGVATYIDDSFKAAVEYRAAQKAYAALDRATQARTVPPRKDLELETLAEIVEGTRLVHCHSYRQDEIVMLLRTAERFGFRVATLQHVLEGYKVAPEIAKHGAGASSFSDWWAYKIEVMDAIPWNGALLHRAGVLVSFNSDSDELARRMNMEAAKAVRYGGLSPEQALALVTINPAKQLRIDNRTGSLEVGKDADLAIWNGDPLSAFSRCEETWVDGLRRYRRADEPAQHDAIRTNRAMLIAKAIGPASDAQGQRSNDGEGRGGMRGGRGRGGRPPNLLERMLEAREDAIWLRIARGQDPFPTKQGECGCGAESAVPAELESETRQVESIGDASRSDVVNLSRN